jgi:Zn-dependent peptidase ImmA (M78 family)/DNA-binding XRE family transcriptional regulator
MERFTPSRLDLARRRRGLTKKDLADAAGISTRALTGYENAEITPEERTLERLAKALRFPVAFFTAADIEEPGIDSVSFRSKSSMTRRQRDQATGSAALATMLGDWIGERFDLPDPDIPRLRHETDPETAAEQVRIAWGLGFRRAPNMVHLLEAHGIRVFSLVEECAEVDAFSFWRDDVPYVFLNTMKSAEHSRMDAVHELGHLVLHFWGGPKGRAAEDQAKRFASAFLMPRQSVVAEAPRGASIPAIVRAKRRWNVSAIALAYRMHQVGLLTEWQARTAYIEMGKLGYRTSEPDEIPRESSQVLSKVFGALREDGLTMASIAHELRLPAVELNNVVFGLTMTGHDGQTTSAPRRPQLKLVS